MPGDLADDDDAAMVLERAGQTLTIARWPGRDQKELLHQARAGLLHELRQAHSLSADEVLVRSMALGLADVAHYVPVVLRLDMHSGQTPTGLQLRERELLEALLAVLDSSRATALSASLQSGQIGMVLGVSAKQLEEPLLERIFRQLSRGQAGIDWSVGVGRGTGKRQGRGARVGRGRTGRRDRRDLRLQGPPLLPFYRCAAARTAGADAGRRPREVLRGGGAGGDP